MSGRVEPIDPAERLVRRTRWRLAAFTLMLVGALLGAVGITTALVAMQLMHDNIERALVAAADDAAAAGVEIEPDEAEGEGAAHEDRERSPASSDTFVLLLDARGRLLSNPSGIGLPDLPDLAAVQSAVRGEDRRTGSYGGTPVRLLTRAVVGAESTDDEHPTAAYVQAGFVLTLHVAQEQQLLWAIGAVWLMGLLGAAVVTALVTHRALVPIRTAFATERRFVAAASHELRTPPAIIRATAEIIEREGLVADEGHGLVADIVAEADRLSRLVTDLLALASANAGAIPVERRPLQLRSWLDDLARRADSLARTRGLRLVTNFSEGPASSVVVVDRDRLDQLLLILVDNAIDHSPPDGAITLALRTDGTGIVIEVSDQGPGIPPADRDRIFEPFARLPARRRRHPSGSGLGLTIARQLAAQHEGELQVDDAPGGGARFRLRLPLAPVGTAIQAPAASRA
jgi:signal transduction histidine kinase